MALKNQGDIIVTDGNVGIGTTSPNDKLDVNGNIRANTFTNRGNTTYFLNPSSTFTSLNIAGNISAAGNFYSSDRRLKSNIQPIKNSIEKLNKINGYTFEWEGNPSRIENPKDIGVIAQEIEEIIPEIISTDTKGYKSVDYPKLTAFLISVLKEQQKEINEIKSKL